MEGSINFKIESTAPEYLSNTRIKVIGVGGAGGNAVDYMIASGLKNVDFITANTDAQALNHTKADTKIALGQTGRGAGSRPDQGREAAEQAINKIEEALQDADMVYISAGMGGGTGTGAAPVIARVAREKGILTVAVVTKPFNFEGEERMRVAEAGIETLSREVDALVVILNSKLEEELSDQDVSLEECFEEADKVLYNACSGIVQIIHNVGRINTDFEDVRSVMAEQGRAIIGVSEAEGEDRAVRALEGALNCPLMEDCTFTTVKNMLINVASVHRGLKQSEQRKMDQLIKEKLGDCHPFIKFGISTDETLGDKLRVTIIATGLDEEQHPAVSAEPSAAQTPHGAAVSNAPGWGNWSTPTYGGAPEVPAGAAPHPHQPAAPVAPAAYRATTPVQYAATPASASPQQPVPQPAYVASSLPPSPYYQPSAPQAEAAPAQAETVRRPSVLSQQASDRWGRGENTQIPAVLRQESKS